MSDDRLPWDMDISIHAVLWDRDSTDATRERINTLFQSTRSSGTATLNGNNRIDTLTISIHAVLWDRDTLIRR